MSREGESCRGRRRRRPGREDKSDTSNLFPRLPLLASRLSFVLIALASRTTFSIKEDGDDSPRQGCLVFRRTDVGGLWGSWHDPVKERKGALEGANRSLSASF